MYHFMDMENIVVFTSNRDWKSIVTNEKNQVFYQGISEGLLSYLIFSKAFWLFRYAHFSLRK